MNNLFFVTFVIFSQETGSDVCNCGILSCCVFLVAISTYTVGFLVNPPTVDQYPSNEKLTCDVNIVGGPYGKNQAPVVSFTL